ncbi:MAG TPA: hypothetical protein VGN97_05150 [Mesorhizobium sp.]|jgi:hypothetical protein|nr:hypothetical protein [Mesorhizobium sp.]
MIRFVLLFGLLLLLILGARALYRFLRARDIDWTGVTAAIGFVTLAFWLRHVTGMG